VQTDLGLLVEFACDVFLNQLLQTDMDEKDIKRIKEIVERIKARCRQHGATILGLVGVEFKPPQG